MGRPHTFSQQTVDEICERLSAGEPLAAICRDEHMPGVTTVYRWMDEKREVSESIARARAKGFDAIAEECMAIADETPPMTATGGTDSGHVAWAKHRTETRLKLLAKWDPKRYGDKIDHQVTGGVTVNVVTGVPGGDAGSEDC